MKKEFKLEYSSTMESKIKVSPTAKIMIIGQAPKDRPYVAIDADSSFFIQDRDLELFAINILKALQSKKLK